jgi:hypothetical protein
LVHVDKVSPAADALRVEDVDLAACWLQNVRARCLVDPSLQSVFENLANLLSCQFILPDLACDCR